MRQKIASITQRWRLPAVCLLCHQYHRHVMAICDPCINLFTRITHACVSCCLPLSDSQFLQCGNCIKNKPAFDQVMSVYSFEEPLRTLIHQFKYQETLCLRNLLVNLMLDALPLAYQPDCLVPVPMHANKLKQRGFNQAAELTKLLAKKLNLPFDLTLCEKKLNTHPQMGLDGNHRRRNLQEAFSAKPNAYQHITLIDDLLTTGSTANALALALKKQGAARVDVWCIARTPLL